MYITGAHAYGVRHVSERFSFSVKEVLVQTLSGLTDAGGMFQIANVGSCKIVYQSVTAILTHTSELVPVIHKTTMVQCPQHNYGSMCTTQLWFHVHNTTMVRGTQHN